VASLIVKVASWNSDSALNVVHRCPRESLCWKEEKEVTKRSEMSKRGEQRSGENRAKDRRME
jgi:hypothetical protein